MTPEEIRRDRARALRVVRRAIPDIQTLWVCEWSAACGYHEHVLGRTTRPPAELCDAIRSAARAAGLDATAAPLRNWRAAVRYVFKAVRDERRWARRTPASFGRRPLLGVSRAFLDLPLKRLLRRPRHARPVSTRPTPRSDRPD